VHCIVTESGMKGHAAGLVVAAEDTGETFAEGNHSTVEDAV